MTPAYLKARKRADARPRINDVFLRRPLTRLVARWRAQAQDWSSDRAACLRRCASQLSRILKP